MKPLIVPACALLFILWGCCESVFEDCNSLEQSDQGLSLKGAVYHEATGHWIQQQKDPYTLDNFQKAYNKLSSGKSFQNLTRSLNNEFSDKQQLKATHYALKIFPKNENEQRKIELMKDIKVAYIPFDYIYIPDSVIKNATSTTRSTTFSEKNHYTVTNDESGTTAVNIRTRAATLPILYVVWPSGKALPNEMDYQIDYKIFIPEKNTSQTRAKSLSETALEILEKEAIKLALGSSNSSKEEPPTFDFFRGSVKQRDNFLGKDIPLANLKISLWTGSRRLETYTKSDGSFYIKGPIPKDFTMVHMIFEHSKWKISRENYTLPFIDMRGEMIVPTRHYVYSGSYNPDYGPIIEAHRAVNYFYHGAHTFNQWARPSGIRIYAFKEQPDGKSGTFSAIANNPYINIYNINISQHSFVLATIFHELGHYMHFCERGKNLKCDRLLVESFGCYAGWQLTNEYYSSLGYIPRFTKEDITAQDGQLWKPADPSAYTPLFIDLVDNWNQKNASGFDEQIKNVPTSVIRKIIKECSNWSACKKVLQQYIGVYYTARQLKNYTDAFDYWSSRN